MALCQLCESSRAVVLDTERLPPEECDGLIVQALALLGTRPSLVQRSLIDCPDCKRRYRLVKLPIDESYSKRHLRTGS